MRPESTLLSDMEPIEGVINAIRAGSDRAERISQTLLTPEPPIRKKRVNTYRAHAL
jgi:hypothetical protein